MTSKKTIEKIMNFIFNVRREYGKPEFSQNEVNEMPKRGISVPGAFRTAIVPGSRPKKYSLIVLEESLHTKPSFTISPKMTEKEKSVLEYVAKWEAEHNK